VISENNQITASDRFDCGFHIFNDGALQILGLNSEARPSSGAGAVISERAAGASIAVAPIAHGFEFVCRRMRAVEPQFDDAPCFRRNAIARERLSQRRLLQIGDGAVVRGQPRHQLVNLIYGLKTCNSLQLGADFTLRCFGNAQGGVQQVAVNADTAIINCGIELPKGLFRGDQSRDAVMQLALDLNILLAI
jgi:hypothetical protein